MRKLLFNEPTVEPFAFLAEQEFPEFAEGFGGCNEMIFKVPSKTLLIL